jgi:hypothetical protein
VNEPAGVRIVRLLLIVAAYVIGLPIFGAIYFLAAASDEIERSRRARKGRI